MDMHPQDLVIIQTMSLLAEKHGCKITNVDVHFDAEQGYPVGQIQIEGGEEKKEKLAQEIDKTLKALEKDITK